MDDRLKIASELLVALLITKPNMATDPQLAKQLVVDALEIADTLIEKHEHTRYR